jgi:hypothetical protein
MHPEPNAANVSILKIPFTTATTTASTEFDRN